MPGTRYSVRARAYNNYNVYSEWSEALEFVTPEDDGVPGPVTSISSSFTSPDLLLSWDAPDLNVDGSVCNDIAFYRLEITGYAGVTRVYKSLNESFQLTYATQKKDFNTPIPNPHIVISVVDTANNESTPVSTDPLNLAPSQPSAPVVDAIPGALSVVMSSEGVEDFYYFVLQVSQDNTTWSNLYSGADDNYHHAVAGGLTRYYRYKVVDRFGQESPVSSSVSATAISLSGTHSHYLEDLIDVNATPNDGDILYWDGSFWSATPGGGGSSVEYLNDLLDVDTTSGLAIDKVLKYNGSLWVPQTETVTEYLNDLLDVNTTGRVSGDVLSFDGANWVPLSIGGGGSDVAVAYVSHDPPATPIDGQLWFDENNQFTYIYYEAATPSSTWIDISGGSSSSEISIDNYSSFSSVYGVDEGYDYEFNSTTTTLPSGWAWVNQGSSIYEEGFGYGVIYPEIAGGTYDWRMVVESLPAGDWTAWAAVTGDSISTQYSPGLVFRESGTGKFAQVMVNYSTNSADWYFATWDDEFTYVTTIAYGTIRGSQIKYIKAETIGSDMNIYFSADGTGWIKAVSSYAMTMTFDQIGFGSTNTQATEKTYVGLRWIRIRT